MLPDFQCARSLDRFSVPAPCQAHPRSLHPSFHFVPFVSIESYPNTNPNLIISSSLQLPFSFFHQLLALLLGVAVAYASPT